MAAKKDAEISYKLDRVEYLESEVFRLEDALARANEQI